LELLRNEFSVFFAPKRKEDRGRLSDWTHKNLHIQKDFDKLWRKCKCELKKVLNLENGTFKSISMRTDEGVSTPTSSDWMLAFASDEASATG
jgi:hypothetical protein